MHTVRGRKRGGRLVLVLVGVVAGGMIGPAAQEPGSFAGEWKSAFRSPRGATTFAYPRARFQLPSSLLRQSGAT